ncbi:hypothetical protein EC973_000171 [Apophysomyces ossiformis]|uniref:Protein-serine/threonine kinase n=1 Tax=Apophysomyces ossiformis TaxID=679940 RepID=A0A8H7EUD9_9FUNG|nr:hypothetical protein EC973_000171 [Apophysomyces ossiformis]
MTRLAKGMFITRYFSSNTRAARLNVENYVRQNSPSISNQHFYMNKILDQYVQQQATPITLRQLVFYERHMNIDRLLKSANYVRRELPIRISHRIREFQKLPFIVGTNPNIQMVYDLYWQAFERLRKVPPITSMEENEDFCRLLKESLEAHLVVIPRLAQGISECEQHIDPERLDRFMNGTLRSRISRRVLTEQHLVLSQYKHGITTIHASSPLSSSGDLSRSTQQTVFSRCSAHDVVGMCSALAQANARQIHRQGPEWIPPQVHITHRDSDVEFTYVSEHIEYIIYQILSNSIRHTIAAHPQQQQQQQQQQYPPIEVTICSNQSDVFFRISDKGGGMSNDVHKHLWSYGRRPHKTFGNFRDISQLAAKPSEHWNVPLGIGLPMSRVYAEYWGGEINVVTMEGCGTDAYVRIPILGTQNENLDMEDNHDISASSPSSSSSGILRRQFIV